MAQIASTPYGSDLFQWLAVVVVNFGDPHLLRSNLVGVAADLAPARVVVVDNYSTSEARAEVRELCDTQGWVGVYPKTNTGFGTGCNLGAQAAIQAGAERLLFLNPDAAIGRHSTQLLLVQVAEDDFVLVAPTMVTSDGRTWSVGIDLDLDTGDMRSWGGRLADRPTRNLPWVSGACFMISARLWEAAGGFDDDYFLYWEDVDLCASVQARGGRVRLVSEAIAVHDPGQTHTARGSRAKSATYYYYNIRNRQVFAAKWLPEQSRRRWRRTGVRAAYRILLRGGRRQFLHPVTPVGAAWRGLRDGKRSARMITRKTDGRELLGPPGGWRSTVMDPSGTARVAAREDFDG